MTDAGRPAPPRPQGARPQPARSQPPAQPPQPAPAPSALLAGLTGERLVEAFVAAEILAPPLTLRADGTFGPRNAL